MFCSCDAPAPAASCKACKVYWSLSEPSARNQVWTTCCGFVVRHSSKTAKRSGLLAAIPGDRGASMASSVGDAEIDGVAAHGRQARRRARHVRDRHVDDLERVLPAPLLDRLARVADDVREHRLVRRATEAVVALVLVLLVVHQAHSMAVREHLIQRLGELLLLVLPRHE